MEKQFITRTEAAKQLGVSRQTITNYIKSGFFETFKTATKSNGKVLVDLESFNKFVDGLYKENDIKNLELRVIEYKKELLKTQNELDEKILENKRKIKTLEYSSALRYFLIHSEKFWYVINNLLRHIKENSEIYLNTDETEFKPIDYIVLNGILTGKSVDEISKNTNDSDRSIITRFYRTIKKISQLKLIDSSSEKDKENSRLREIIKSMSKKLSKQESELRFKNYPINLRVTLEMNLFEFLDKLEVNTRTKNCLQFYFHERDKTIELFNTPCSRLLQLNNFGRKTLYDLKDSIKNYLGDNISDLKDFELFKEGAH